LKVGLLMGSYWIPAWQYLMAEKIIHCGFAAIEFIVVKDGKKASFPKFDPFLKKPQYFLYRWYSKLDELLFRQNPDAFEIKDARNILTGIPEINFVPESPVPGNSTGDTLLEKIKRIPLDVLIDLGFGDLDREILKLPRFGVWSYHHGDDWTSEEGPVGFWEVFEDNPVTGSMLKMASGESGDEIPIYRSYSYTDWLSVIRNNNKLFFKSASFVPRKLKEYHVFGEEAFLKDKEKKDLEFNDKPFRGWPTNGQMLIHLFKLLKKFLRKKIPLLFCMEQWQLMFRFGKGISRSFHQFKPLAPPPEKFWADPHILFKDGQYYIVFEELDYETNKGYISVIPIDAKGNGPPPTKIIEEPHHLSYPFPFEWKGEYYIVPESSQNQSIDVYKCVEFPYQWEFHKRIFNNITAADNTLAFLNGKWWLFTNVCENPGCDTSEELFLFFADDPLSTEWQAHPLNPIVSDSRRARPAGRILEYGGSIYRPAQNTGGPWGLGISLNKIIKLSETEYQEIEVGVYKPFWDKRRLRIHTLAYDRGLTVIDALTLRPKFPFWNK
ncbi:MAG: hypothetical protein ACE5EK_08145, partial [Nitrospinales bacterium]